MKDSKHCVVFSLDDQFYALPLPMVERVTRAVAVTPLPKASDIVMGVINLQGRVVPVVNIRKRFSLTDQDLSAEHHFIIGNINGKYVAIFVDNVLDIVEIPEEGFVGQEEMISEIPFISGIIKQQEKMILVHDLEKLLSLDEMKRVEKDIQKMESKTTPKDSPKTRRRKK